MIDLLDDVAGPQASLRRGRSGIDRSHDHALDAALVLEGLARLLGEARKPYPKRFLHRVLLLRFILVVGDLGLLLAVLETPQRHGLGHFLSVAHDHDLDRLADGHRGDETRQIA